MLSVLERTERTFSDDIHRRHTEAGLCFAGPAIRVLTQDSNHKDRYVPARPLWEGAGVASDDVNKILSPDGAWIYRVSPEEWSRIFALPFDDFFSEMCEVIEPLYRPVQPVLDKNAQQPLFGFNNHEFKLHVMKVCQDVMDLMDILDRSPMEKKLAVFAALSHDAGNVLGRSHHANHVDHIWNNTLETFAVASASFDEAILAILTHNESAGIPILEAALLKAQLASPNPMGEINYKQFFANYAQSTPIIASVLRIADKAQVADYRRTYNSKVLTAEALEDRHFLASAVCEYENMRWDEAAATYELNLGVSVKNQKLLDKHPLLATQNEYHETKLALPPDWKKKFQNGNGDPSALYISQATDLFWELYGQKMLLFITDSFNIFPQAKRVKIVFKDRDPFYHGNKPHPLPEIVYTFNRNSYLSAPMFRENVLNVTNQMKARTA